MANPNKDNTLDIAGALRKVIDADDESMRFTPSSAVVFDLELSADLGNSIMVQPRSSGSVTAFNALDASVNHTSSSINITNYRIYCVQFIWAGLADTLDGEIKVQGSLDNINFSDILGVVTTLDTSDGGSFFNVTDAAYNYIKIVYTANSIVDGTITALYSLKG